MAQKASGYGRKWKKWLAIYVAVGAVAYLIVFLVFFHHGGGGDNAGLDNARAAGDDRRKAGLEGVCPGCL